MKPPLTVIEGGTPKVVALIKPRGEVIHVETQPAEWLPPIDVPQPTEPQHIGRTFREPSRRIERCPGWPCTADCNQGDDCPARSTLETRGERASWWLLIAIALVSYAAVVVLALWRP